MTKQELRRYMREQKGLHGRDELDGMSRSVIAKLFENQQFAEAQTILMYHSLPDEVCTHEAIKELVGMGKTVLLPRVVSDTEMTIHRYSSDNDLQISSLGILEPSGEVVDDYEKIDVAVVPGMAFDKEGNRLGRGKGYYDRFLCATPYIYIIGICFPFQLVEHVPTDENDRRMNTVIC